MDFGDALKALKEGASVARKGWNGKGMYLTLQEGSQIDPVNARGGVARQIAMGQVVEAYITIGAHIDMCSAHEEVVVGWSASQTDMLAEDWLIL